MESKKFTCKGCNLKSNKVPKKDDLCIPCTNECNQFIEMKWGKISNVEVQNDA